MVHHIGGDFGEKTLTIGEAKNQIKNLVQLLSSHGRRCVLQIGYNWKGDVSKPLFANGTKSELIDFVTEVCAGFWDIEQISIYNPNVHKYEPVSNQLLQPFVGIGEFLNRPIFLLRRST